MRFHARLPVRDGTMCANARLTTLSISETICFFHKNTRRHYMTVVIDRDTRRSIKILMLLRVPPRSPPKPLAWLRRVIDDSYEPDEAEADEDGADEEGVVETAGFSMLVFTLL